ncbi:WLM domain-containing protein [Lyophyllum atratum]|nr:WLM domain-containing protein [Lyophyllum atratum]
MVHHRLNEKETNPNPHVNFITALHAHEGTEQESARQLLRALAAQVRPIMKSHGFSVNSLEEYEHNSVFAGRNWNAGETVELVLRRPDRTFLPTFWLMSTLCHELAHIKHMNHGPAFQALWKRLRAEVRALQDKQYYGDGYWSSGTRLADNTRVAGVGIEAGDLPEYMCGGAQTRTRPSTTRTRRSRKPRDTTITASTSSGRQTAKRRKAGARVTSKTAFVGNGMTLAEDVVDGKGKGAGFGKQAASKRAREERALATERRILALQGQAKASSSSSPPTNIDSETEDEVDEVEDAIPETDSDRRKTLLASELNDDLDELKSGILWESFENDFEFSGSQGQSSRDSDLGCDLPSGSGSTDTIGASTRKGKRKKYTSDDDDDDAVVILPATKVSKTSLDTASSQKGKLTQTEAVNIPIRGSSLKCQNLPQKLVEREPPPTSQQWACLVCTLNNDVEHLACSACAMPRGEETWKHQ